MANVNSIYGAKLAAPLTNPTAASVFLTQDSVTANAGAPSLATKAAVVYLPEVQTDASGNIGATNQVFPVGTRVWNIRIAGRVSAGASGTFGIAVQIGSSTTAASNVTLFTATPQTYNLLGDYLVEIVLTHDQNSKLLSGFASSAGGTAEALQSQVALTAQTVDLSKGKQPICVTGVFGTSNTSNVAYLDRFDLGVL